MTKYHFSILHCLLQDPNTFLGGRYKGLSNQKGHRFLVLMQRLPQSIEKKVVLDLVLEVSRASYCRCVNDFTTKNVVFKLSLAKK
jgi:UV DNA damage repair endonuclease